MLCGIVDDEPAWNWRDSVTAARSAWPELKGNGVHGLASLKAYLGLRFEHHDAGEDARAAAEVVLLAESGATGQAMDFEVLDDRHDVMAEHIPDVPPRSAPA